MAAQVLSDIERIVYIFLEKRGIAFEFQVSVMGGWYQLGGAVIDFLIPDRMLAWRVQGEYWHKGIRKSGIDAIQREMLKERGWQVIDLWGDDLLNRPDETLRKALLGEEMLG